MLLPTMTAPLALGVWLSIAPTLVTPEPAPVQVPQVIVVVLESRHCVSVPLARRVVLVPLLNSKSPSVVSWDIAFIAPWVVIAPVPPSATPSVPVKVMLPVADRAMLPDALIAKVPLASGSVIVLAADAVPVIRKLLVAVPPRYKSLNGAEPEPKSIVDAPVNRLVLMATAVKLDKLVLAPPPPPPRQFPAVVQTTYEPAAEFGKLIVVLAVGALNPIIVVKPLSVAVSVVEALPCNVNDWPVAPTVSAAPGVMFVKAVNVVMSALEPD